MRRMYQDRGFGLLELLVSLSILVFVMVGAYSVTMRNQRQTMYSTKVATLSKSSQAVRWQILKQLRNLGYNPGLVEWSDDTGSSSYAEMYDERMGLVYMRDNRIDFTADDDYLLGCTAPKCRTENKVEISELYSFWASTSDTDAVVSFADKIDENADEPCTLSSGELFENSYNLYSRVKLAHPDDDSDDYLATVPSLLARNVLCFEVRYFTRGDEPGDDEIWERLYAGAKTDYQPPTIHPDDGSFDEGDYYSFIRDYVQRIEISVLVAGSDDTQKDLNPLTGDHRKTELIVVDSNITNLPWLVAQNDFNPPL